jgi:hypothetical protein
MLDGVLFGPSVPSVLSNAAARHSLTKKKSTQKNAGDKEALMPGIRSDRARARARNLLATVYPIPDDAEFHRLRELAVDYIQEAERLEAERKGRVIESDEMISAALDAVARDYFARALLRAVSPQKALARGMERRARGNSA